VGSEQLKLMRPTSVLINTARGDLVDMDALTAALKENRILGAGLDVFGEEPPPAASALMALENVVLTPHIGFKTREALGRLAKAVIENVEHFLAGSSENLLP
jgi:phosphoglycerate dehydrogenase-like enzyme